MQYGSKDADTYIKIIPNRNMVEMSLIAEDGSRSHWPLA
jgi:hypothetical protein